MDSELKNKKQRFQFWVLVIALFIISLVLGVIGYERYYEYHKIPHNLINSFYNTLQLYVLESGSFLDYLPVELNIARFSAPLISLIAIMITILQIFRKQWERFKISLLNNHIIVIGYGAIGENITKDLLTKKKKILVIDLDIDSNEKDIVNSSKFKIMKVDALNKNVLKKTRIKHADTVYILTDNDSTQIKICLEIYSILKESKRKNKYPLTCIMHLNKQELMSTLKNYKLVQNIKDSFILKVFNVHESNARDLFEEFPLDKDGISFNSEDFVQVLIFGFDLTGESIAIQTALTGHYLNGDKPRIIIFDDQAESRLKIFHNKYPSFNEYCDIEQITIESNNPQLLNKVLPYINIPNSLTSMVLCYEDETKNLLLGLQFDQIEFSRSVTILIQISDEIRFKTFSNKVRPFGITSRVCSHDVICNESLDKKAIAFHNNYLDKRREEKDFGSKNADVIWEELSQEYKDSNRKAADHIGVKMRAIGCEVVNIEDPRPEVTITQKELLMLAKLEHKRWNAERSLAGWTFNEIRNNNSRKTPDLTTWENLTKEIQDYDMNAVQSIPDVLAFVGLKSCRLISF